MLLPLEEGAVGTEERLTAPADADAGRGGGRLRDARLGDDDVDADLDASVDVEEEGALLDEASDAAVDDQEAAGEPHLGVEFEVDGAVAEHLHAAVADGDLRDAQEAGNLDRERSRAELAVGEGGVAADEPTGEAEAAIDADDE